MATPGASCVWGKVPGGVWNINKYRRDATRSYTTPHTSLSSSKSPAGDGISGISPRWHTGPLGADTGAEWRLRARQRPVRCGTRPCGIPRMFIYVPNTFRHTQEPSGTIRERCGPAQIAAGGWAKICYGILGIRPLKKTQAYILCILQ